MNTQQTEKPVIDEWVATGDKAPINLDLFKAIPFKQKSIIPAIIMSGVLSCASIGAHASNSDIKGVVVGVTDGDTITVLDNTKKQHTVRLAYVDAPETSCHAKEPSLWNDLCIEKSQPFGKASKKNLSDLVYQAEVRVKLISGSTYEREIGVVYAIKNGREINANYEQIRSGYAWFYKKYAKKQMTHGEYTAWNAAETLARSSHTGLWSDPKPVSPWDYRRSYEGGGVSFQDNKKTDSKKTDSDSKNATSVVMQNVNTITEAGADIFNRVRSKMKF